MHRPVSFTDGGFADSLGGEHRGWLEAWGWWPLSPVELPVLAETWLPTETGAKLHIVRDWVIHEGGGQAMCQSQGKPVQLVARPFDLPWSRPGGAVTSSVGLVNAWQQVARAQLAYDQLCRSGHNLGAMSTLRSWLLDVRHGSSAAPNEGVPQELLGKIPEEFRELAFLVVLASASGINGLCGRCTLTDDSSAIGSKQAWGATGSEPRL